MTTNLTFSLKSEIQKKSIHPNHKIIKEDKCHFSVEGVQIYSVDDIKYMIAQAEKKMQQLPQGQFIKPKEYHVDFGDYELQKVLNRPQTVDNWRGKLTVAKISQVKLEKAKEKEEETAKNIWKLKKIKKQLDEKELLKPTKIVDNFVKPIEDAEDIEVDEDEGDECVQPCEDTKIDKIDALDSSFQDVDIPSSNHSLLSSRQDFSEKLSKAINFLASNRKK